MAAYWRSIAASAGMPWVLKLSPDWRAPTAVHSSALLVTLGTEWAAEHHLILKGALVAPMVVSISVPMCPGPLASLLLHRKQTFRVVERYFATPHNAMIATVALLAALAVDATPEWLIGSISAWLVVALVPKPDQSLSRVFGNPFVIRIGTISYGMYLMHMTCLNTVRRLTPQRGPLPTCVQTAVLASACAWVSYRAFESPILRLEDRIGGRQARPTAT